MRTAMFTLLLMVIAGCADRAPPEIAVQNIRPAKLMTVSRQAATREFEFTARVEAFQSIDLSFEVGGPLKEVLVKEGETVAQGSPIAALDATDFLLSAREAEVQLKLAAQDLDRKQKVLLENGIAKSLVEDAQSNYELQQVRLRAARERLNDSKMVAPFDAYVSRRYVDSFVNITPGTPIVRLHDLNRLQVVLSIPENLVATVNADQLLRAWAKFSFAPEQEFELTYFENRGEADSLAQTYEVAFLMERPAELNLLPGMTASANLQLKANAEGYILLPSSALIPTAAGELSAWIFNPDTQQVTQKIVETGSAGQNGVQITAGLRGGEQIVVAGASQLQAGMQIRPL